MSHEQHISRRHLLIKNYKTLFLIKSLNTEDFAPFYTDQTLIGLPWFYGVFAFNAFILLTQNTKSSAPSLMY